MKEQETLLFLNTCINFIEHKNLIEELISFFPHSNQVALRHYIEHSEVEK